MTREQWKPGDRFYRPEAPTRIRRVCRTHGRTVFHVSDELGEYPPRGCISATRYPDTLAFVRLV